MKRLFILVFTLISLTSTAFSKQSTNNPFDMKYNIESYGQDPGASPEVVRARLEALPTEIEMRYTSEVHSYIDRYMKYGRKQITSLLVLSSYYMPIFEQALAEAGLPDELKYLPIIESNLNAKATSKAGAAGLWQFMPIAARGYDMKITSGLDERRDPYLSSERAAKLLKDLYNRFGDWSLAIAAYNCGPGTVQKALKRAGGDKSKHTFWTISSYLPAETRKYVPLFIAMNYVMNYYTEHEVPQVTIDQPFTTDTVRVSDRVTFKKIASTVDVTVEELRKLNPQYTSDVVPATTSRPCNVILPTDMAYEYKVKLGRTPEVKTAQVADKPKDDKKQNRTRKMRETAYESIPDPSMPNTYIRVRKPMSDGDGVRNQRRRNEFGSNLW